MPIFEYKCQNCGHRFEELVLEKEKIKCPKCGSHSLNKLFSTFNISPKSNGKNSQGCQGGICNICPACKE